MIFVCILIRKVVDNSAPCLGRSLSSEATNFQISAEIEWPYWYEIFNWFDWKYAFCFNCDGQCSLYKTSVDYYNKGAILNFSNTKVLTKKCENTRMTAYTFKLN